VTLAKLNHPRIAAIHELARQDHDLLMVMEYVNGETCEKLLARTGPLPVARAVVLCDQILDALEHAHAAGIVHRDLKPGNVMVTGSGDVKVMDFGIARVAGSEHLTMEGYMMGTPAYMAPEQVRGEEVDRRMDLYAAAVMLYRLVTHRLPFEGDSAISLIHSQLTDPPTPPRQFRPDLPEWIDAILTRGLAKAPIDRFQTAAEFRLALERGLAGALTRPPRAGHADENAETIGPMVTPTALRRLPNATPPPAPAAAPSGTARTETSVTLRAPHLAVAGILLVLLVVAVGLLAFAALRRPVAPVVAPTTTETEPTPPAEGATAAPSLTSEPPATEPAPTDLAAAATQVPTPASVPAPSGPSTLAPQAAKTSPSAAAATSTSIPGSAAAGSTKPAQTPGSPPPPTTAGSSTGKPPAAAGTATSTASSTPPAPSQPAPAEAAGRGAAASSAGTATGSPTTSLPESFGDIKTLIADGTKSRELDALLILEPERLVVRNRDNGSILQTTPYQSIAAATYARSKQPRWQEDGNVAQIPKNFSGSGFFLKSSRHWLTLQSKTEFVILRLEDKNFRMVLASVETRTGLKIQQPVARD
jgi:serine/threonine-protein kinase